VAFILRASGTKHGDWWTLHGIQYFLLAAMLALLSKYLVQVGGRHIFNLVTASYHSREPRQLIRLAHEAARATGARLSCQRSSRHSG
jgi:hypothetical protein